MIDGAHSGFHLLQVAHCFGEDEVGAGFGHDSDLFGEELRGLVHSHHAEGIEQFSGRADGGPHQHIAGLVGDFARQLHTGCIQFSQSVLQVMHFEPGGGAAEGVGGNDVGSGLDVAAIDRLHGVRVHHIPQFGRVAACEAGVLQHRGHGAVAQEGAVVPVKALDDRMGARCQPSA